MSKLQVKYLPLNEIIPYVNNARTHDDMQVSQIAASIKEFGFNNPILLDEQKGIIAGHGRLAAAQNLGLKEVPCVYLKHLTEAQRKAYILADNRIALNAGWDTELLKMELKELENSDFDMMLLGFEDTEIKGLFGEFEPGSEDEQSNLDEKQMIFLTCPNCGDEFEQQQAEKRKA